MSNRQIKLSHLKKKIPAVVTKMKLTDEQQANGFFVRHEVLTAVLLKIHVF
jgi:hypothetical protein